MTLYRPYESAQVSTIQRNAHVRSGGDKVEVTRLDEKHNTSTLSSVHDGSSFHRRVFRRPLAHNAVICAVHKLIVDALRGHIVASAELWEHCVHVKADETFALHKV